MTARTIWLALVVPGLCLLVVGIARAAEPASRPHEITLHFKGADYDAVQRTYMTLATYASRTECEVMITRVRVAVKGARLVCTPTESYRVQ